jgi:PQQ-dependent catabolism-associated CXXCW motif protein
MTPRRALAAAVCLIFLAAAAEPEGYRMEDYRAPVPATLKGARVATTKDVEGLKDVLFVDVMPRLPKPGKLPAGTIWRDKPRNDIPGSIWLSNTGYGALSAETEAYFEGALRRETKGNKAHQLLFYCMSECWMSWNAAKRALALGYANVIWYPGGADGWEKAGHALVPAKPYELP